MERRTGEVIDVGRSALHLVERRSELDAVWPMRNGVVSDAGVLQRFVTRLMRPYGGSFLDRLHLVVAVPSSSSPIERRSVREAGRRAGASQVHLIEHVMAAALGANLPLHEPVGTMILNVGAGITEAALLSLGCIVASSSVRSGSADIDLAIKNVLRREYAMVISDRTAEDIKLALSGVPANEQVMIEARGQMAIDGSTVTAILERDEVQSILDEYVAASVEAVRATLVQAPPELGQDVLSRGVHLAGGGALLGGLAPRLVEAFGVPVHVIDEPERAVINGAGKCLEAKEDLRSLFIGEAS